ncbi:hypothetical protein BBJ28_00013545 [Nothophytophthora sp. Chile5]|nr:hypothetical protein BBJ28_00013545 [Nothophytophthora sp. Chile5]
MRRRKEGRSAAPAVSASKPGTQMSSKSADDAPSSLSWGDVAVLLALASGTLAGYTATLYPSIAGGDSGELVAESCHLGVSHPPGYPLFTMAVHLVTTSLPFGGTPAWRANFFSAVVLWLCNVTTLTGLLHHIRRADYGTFRLYASHDANEDLWTRLYLYGVDLSTREIPLQLAFPVVALGIWQSFRLNRQLGGFLLGMYGFYMVVFHALANLPISEGLIYGVQMRFWQQPNVVVFLWLGLGLNYAIWRWHGLCNQSQAFYIRNYAQALLDPLPRNAVLFVNFDLQWTSLRYLQRCELRRPDVTVLNLSMMTYHWFAAKHEHYPHLQFPGTRLVPFGSARPRRFFLGGRLSYNDQDFNAKYTLVPYGLLDEFQSHEGSAPSLKNWYSSQQKVKTMVRERLPLLPPAEMYNEETWEWTIARDHAMKALSWATYLLEKTIAEDPHNLLLLSEATHPMEASYQFEPPQFWNAASNLKNLGLAYAQIVKSSQEFDGVNDPFLNQEVGQNVQDSARFKDRASARMLEVWDAWLQVPEAKQDPGYKAIEGVVRQFVPKRDDQQLEQPKSGKSTRQRQKRTKRRKVKTQTTSERLPQ